jgi:hypothetical protein
VEVTRRVAEGTRGSAAGGAEVVKEIEDRSMGLDSLCSGGRSSRLGSAIGGGFEAKYLYNTSASFVAPREGSGEGERGSVHSWGDGFVGTVCSAIVRSWGENGAESEEGEGTRVLYGSG